MISCRFKNAHLAVVVDRVSGTTEKSLAIAQLGRKPGKKTSCTGFSEHQSTGEVKIIMESRMMVPRHIREEIEITFK